MGRWEHPCRVGALCRADCMMADRGNNTCRDLMRCVTQGATQSCRLGSISEHALWIESPTRASLVHAADALCGALLMALQCARSHTPPHTAAPTASNGHPRPEDSTAPLLATALLQLLPHLITLTTTQSMLQTSTPSSTYGDPIFQGGGASHNDMALIRPTTSTTANGSSAGVGSAAAAGATRAPLASLAVVSQLLVEVVGRWLSPAEWVPMMRGAMRGALLPGLDSGGGGSQGSSAAGQPAQVGSSRLLSEARGCRDGCTVQGVPAVATTRLSAEVLAACIGFCLPRRVGPSHSLEVAVCTTPGVTPGCSKWEGRLVAGQQTCLTHTGMFGCCPPVVDCEGALVCKCIHTLPSPHTSPPAFIASGSCKVCGPGLVCGRAGVCACCGLALAVGDKAPQRLPDTLPACSRTHVSSS